MDARNARDIGSAIVLAILAACAFLEGFFGVCVGCICFRILIKMGMVSEDVNVSSDDIFEEQETTITELEFTRLNEPFPTVHNAYGDKEKGEIPYVYKPKTDEMIRENFNILKHIRGYYFVMPMGELGLAVTWKYVRATFNSGDRIWHGLSVVGAIVFCLMLVLYSLKWILYPRKVVKEFRHPLYSNFLPSIPLCILLLSALATERDDKLAEILFWIGAPLQALCGVIWSARWFTNRLNKGYLHPSMMVPVVGNMVAALVGPSIVATRNYTEVSWFFWSYGFLMYIVLLSITSLRVISGTPLDDRMKPSLALYIAAPCVACMGYVSMNMSTVSLASTGGWDNFARFCYFVGVFVSLVLLYMMHTHHFARNIWDMIYWSWVFPACTVAIASASYANFLSLPSPPPQGNAPIEKVLAYGYLIIATYLTVISGLWTVVSILKRRVFIPEDKWGPLSSNKIVHFAMKESSNQILRGLRTMGVNDSAKFQRIKLQFDRLVRIHEDHSFMEDAIIFRAMDDWVPGYVYTGEEEHAEEAVMVKDMQTLFAATVVDEKIVKDLAEKYAAFNAHLISHISNEELNLNPIIRQYMSVIDQKNILRKQWKSLPAANWRRMICFAMECNTVHGRRVRYLQSLRLVFPEKMGLIGKWIYEDCKPLLFERLIVDVPEIIPRNVRGHIRYY
eukprot:GILJ01024745.1.p1 GENE.GILJ01024745.1~~GILJ01024745.1.p1  ORF type:complete len:779 (+),score=100.26 GILJ01024745.1:312-2339(+)